MKDKLNEVVIVAAARTPIGSYKGLLKKIKADQLGSIVIKEVINRAKFETKDIDEVILGQVLTAGAGQNPARQAAINANIPNSKPAYLVNQVCGSGLRAVISGYQSIKLGDVKNIICGGNLQVGTDSATVNFTNSNSTGTKFIEIGATGANSDSLLVVHSSGYGVGYFGFDAANERLIMATDAGGTHKIAFCLDAGTTTGGGSDNIGSATPALEIDNQKNITVGGVGTFGGGVTIGYNTTTYSPIQKSDNTWFYTRLDQSSSISGTNIINLAQGSSKISDSIPRSVMTRQSDAGSYSLYHSSSTNGSAVTNFSAADPFSPSTHGLTMGCLVRLHESGNNGSGVIFYGDTSSDNHFFVRYKYSSGGLRIGEDTDGSDNWSLAYPTDRFTNDNCYFTVFAVAGNGTMYVSLNGEEKIPIRTLGSTPTPTDARFGICGDPYNDNDSRHRYATMFWYKGLMPNDMIKAEYDWLKTIWTGASLP